MAVGWGIHPRSCELAHELDATVGWGIHSRSCQLAHEVDAPVASGGTQYVFMWCWRSDG